MTCARFLSRLTGYVALGKLFGEQGALRFCKAMRPRPGFAADTQQ